MNWLEELRDVVASPLPMRDGREEQLLATLLDDLTKGPLDEPRLGTDRPRGAPDVVVELDRRADRRAQHSGAAWYLRAAAAVMLVLGLVVVTSLVTDVEPATDHELAARAIGFACASFAEDAPSPDSVDGELRQVPRVVDGLEVFRELFDEFVRSIEQLDLTDLPRQTRDELALVGGFLVQAQLAAAQGGPEPATTFATAVERFDLLIESDTRFDGCRP